MPNLEHYKWENNWILNLVWVFDSKFKRLREKLFGVGVASVLYLVPQFSFAQNKQYDAHLCLDIVKCKKLTYLKMP